MAATDPMALIRVNRHPAPRDLRVFAALWLLFLGGAALLARQRGADGWALGLGLAAAGVGLTGLVRPPAVRWVYLAAVYAAFPIGFVVSHVILGAVFYLVITPIGLGLRLARRDPLDRRPDPARRSYWTEREGPRPPASYFRQH